MTENFTNPQSKKKERKIYFPLENYILEDGATMGAYLSEPKVDKTSTDEMSELLSVGASSMQGWRNSQEDAHNSILNFDDNTSFFAVYDGHGGAEVAAYCADKLPNFLKQLGAYKNGDLDLALKNAFLGFDATLLEAGVIEVLKILAGERNVDVDSEAAEDDEDAEVEDLAELREEGSLPLPLVLQKYKGVGMATAASAPSMPTIKNLIDGPSGSKPQSPFLRGRRNRQENDESASCSSKPKEEATTTNNLKMDTDDDSTVSSSSNQVKESPERKASLTSNGSTVSCSPDSSLVKESIQNGSVTSGKAVSESVSSSDASSSEATPVVALSVKQQNGDVPSPSEESAVAAPSTTGASPVLLSRAAKKIAKSGISSTDMEDDSSSDSDADFEAEENSSTDEDGRAVGFGSEDDDDEDEDEDEEDEDDVEGALANEQFCANMIEEPGKDSGCTAVVALLHGRDLYVANAGDSRCVVCRNGKAIEMSLDHKPEDDEECARIIKAGGRVTLDGRVNGGLNLSRAIGDHAYKTNKNLSPEEQMISALPDVKKLIIDRDDEFMILACDGIWNFMTSEEVVQFVRHRLKDGNKKISQICEELFDKCLAPNTMGDGTGCDNMTAVIVRFKEKLLDLPTKLKEEETEPILLAKQIAEAEEADASLQQSLKRCASPTSADNRDRVENSNKRLKTEDTATAVAALSNECDSGTSSSTSSTTSASSSSAATSSTTAASGTTSSTT